MLGAALGLVMLSASPASATPPFATFDATLTDSNLVTLSWTATGNDTSNLLYIYEDIGFKAADCTPGAGIGCSHSLRVKAGGVHRYTLSVKNDAGEFTNITKEVVVPSLTRPTVPAARVHVDMLNKTAQTLSWSHSGPANDPHEFVEITKAGTFFPIGVGLDGMPSSQAKFPLTGTYSVPASQLPVVGELSYSVAYCRQPDLTKVPICSAGQGVTWVVEPAQFSTSGRRFLPANQAVTLSWAGSGNQWFVSAATLGVSGQWTTTPSLTIPAGQMVAGAHNVSVVSCNFGSGCSNRQDIKAPKAGTVHHLVGWGQLALSSVAQLTPDDGSAVVTLSSPIFGAYYSQVAEGAHVSANALVGFVITDTAGKVQLIVGSGPSVPTFQTFDVTSRFYVQNVDATARRATGAGLDITFDSAGDVWGVGEFQSAASQIHGSMFSEAAAPSGRVWNPASGLFEKSKPFASNFGAGKAAASGLGERVIDTGSAIYFTQGGATGSGNYSRLVRISRTTSDNPATPDDDRVCAIHLPGDDQQLIGVAYDPATNRVWYGERANSGKPAAVSWFVDGELACNNGLQYQLRQPNSPFTEYQNQAAINAADAANRCDPGETSHCIRRIDLPSAAGVPGHVAVDAFSGSLWIVDWTGTALSKIPLNGGTTASVVSYPLPNPVIGGWFRGFPWQIRVDANAVYLNEYSDNQLLRFDKALAGGGTCGALDASGANPCIKEVFLPMAGTQVNAHSIALRDGKLWFTMTAESRGTDAGLAGSYFGYIDTASWAGASAPTGVIYNNLSALGPPPGSDHWSLRGIEAGPSGKVALAEMSSALLVLTPKP